MSDSTAPAKALFWPAYDAQRAQIFGDSDTRLFGERTILPGDADQARQLEADAVLEGAWSPFLDAVREVGARWAREHVPHEKWSQALETIRLSALTELTDKAPTRDELREATAQLGHFLQQVSGALMSGYLETKESLISDQQAAIEELSTPILQVEDRLLVAPLVGFVDTGRARRFTEKLLQAVRDRRARVVVVDVTGVPIVDTGVANHLVKTVDAAGLMGAKVIVTGISPHIAQTLVRLGAALPGVPTAGDLQEGLIEARRFMQAKSQPRVG